MAEEEKAVTHESLRSLLCTDERDFLIRNNGEKVKVEKLEEKYKYVGLYFSAAWCDNPRCDNPPPDWFSTSILCEIYKKLLEKGEFEIVFISSDPDKKSFKKFHQKMPWPAVPYSDENTRDKIIRALRPHFGQSLVILDKTGRVITTDGERIIQKFGIEGYPFTAERIAELNAAQSVETLLISDERDYVVGPEGRKVPVAELVGKMVALHFVFADCALNEPWRDYNDQLVEMYNELQEKGEPFEIVWVSADIDENRFQRFYACMPWLVIPFGDKRINKLYGYFGIVGTPGLIILGPDGKTLEMSPMDVIRQYGGRAYPFNKELLDALEAEKKAKREAETLGSILVSDKRNFVIKNGGAQVLVSEIVGKTVGLYFCSYWCRPCRSFTKKLVKVYNELKERGETFEIVFISSDHEQETFENYYKGMPWLALPFGDKTRDDVVEFYSVGSIPTFIVVHPNGKLVTNAVDATNAISRYGAKAYPFTDAHLQTLEKEIEEHEKTDASSDEGYSTNECPGGAYSTDESPEDPYPTDESPEEAYSTDESSEEDADDAVDEGSEEDADAAIDESSKPSGVICDGDVCYIAR